MDRFSTVVDVSTAARRMQEGDCVVLDCRFNLADPDAGFNAWRDGHITNAQYCHLDRDLSGPITTGTGRHPLPSESALVELFSRLGVDRDVQVFAYDDSAGAIAARAWWLLRYLGHEPVAVISGGASAWRAAAAPWDSLQAKVEPREFIAKPRHDRIVSLEQVSAMDWLCDAREADRYAGEREPMDPVAGHIPGAVNFWFGNNLSENSHFLSPQQLKVRYLQILGSCRPQDAVFYCGSGVTACHNLLAMAHAGLGDGRLYAGSWSQWCADPERPIETGVQTE